MSQSRLIILLFLSTAAVLLPIEIILDCPKKIHIGASIWMVPFNFGNIMTYLAIFSPPAFGVIFNRIRNPALIVSCALLFSIMCAWQIVNFDFNVVHAFSSLGQSGEFPIIGNLPTALNVLFGNLYCDDQFSTGFKWTCVTYLIGFLIRFYGLCEIFLGLLSLRKTVFLKRK